MIFIGSAVLLLLNLVWMKVAVYPQIHREQEEASLLRDQQIAK
jgi:hypothetical protein